MITYYRRWILMVFLIAVTAIGATLILMHPAKLAREPAQQTMMRVGGDSNPCTCTQRIEP